MLTVPYAVQSQFIEDYLLVVMNDHESYEYLKEKAWELPINSLATLLQEEFEKMVDEKAGDPAEVGGLLIRQMLMNQGSDTWYNLARQISEQFAE
jgi:hypothetical protein